MSQHILVPVGGSERAKKSCEFVLEEFNEPTITLLHVINPVRTIDHWDSFGDFQQLEANQRANAEELFEEARKMCTDRGADVQTLIEIGTPATKILDVVEEFDIDHIVMGSQGRKGVRRLLLGSNAETVTRRSPVPVTIVR